MANIADSCDFWIDVEISGIADGPVQQHIASIEQDGNVTRPNWAPKCLVVVEGIILQITIDIVCIHSVCPIFYRCSHLQLAETSHGTSRSKLCYWYVTL